MSVAKYLCSNSIKDVAIKVKCSDGEVYCTTGVLLDNSNLLKDILDEFKEFPDILDLSNFTVMTVKYAMDFFIKNIHVEFKLTVNEMIDVILFMKFIQVEDYMLELFIDHIIRTFEFPYLFFYYYYLEKYNGATHGYPQLGKPGWYNPGTKWDEDTKVYYDKIIELLQDIAEIRKLYIRIRDPIYQDLINRTINFYDFKTHEKFRAFACVVKQWIDATYGHLGNKDVKCAQIAKDFNLNSSECIRIFGSIYNCSELISA